MGLITDRIRDLLRLPGVTGSGLVQFVDSRGLFEDYVAGLSPEDLYRTQPYLRTVISFLARNVAQLGIHVFERVSDTDRRRVKEDPVALLLKRPNPTMTMYDLVDRLVSDWATYNDAYWILEPNLDMDSGWQIQPVPPSWVHRLSGGSLWGPDTMWVLPPGATQPYPVAMENVIRFHGWDPVNMSRGSSPIQALKAVLMEQIHAVRYRDQLWTRAGRVGVTVTRPSMGAGNWTPEQKKQFKDVLDSKLSGDSGSDAGGSIILEDGMTMDRMRFTAHEEEFVEAAKLALATVAQVYHVNPTMIGLLDNANFSNVREFRRMLYGETLGPILAMIEDRLNAFLVPRVALDSDIYVEFNIGEKLQGSFEEQAAVMQSATGRPWQTVNETRARFNMPQIDGGDDLSIPLNILLGGPGGDPDAPAIGVGTEAPAALPAGSSGLSADDVAKLVSAASGLIRSGFDPMASLAAVGLDPIEHLGLLPVTVQRPTDPDGGVDEEIQDALKSAYAELSKAIGEAARPKVLPVLDAPRVADSKDRAPGPYETNVKRVLVATFKRQRAAVTAALGAKAGGDWWDTARWDRELGDDLFRLAMLTATKIGKDTAAALGFDPDDYDETRTLAFLRAVADSRAAAINAATAGEIQDALDNPDEKTVEAVFDNAENQRSGAAAAALITCFSGFATAETGKQLGGGKAVKVWRVNSKDPRPEHARMNGESVPVDEKYSNGAMWPGDPVLGADGVSGCRCSVELIIE